MVLDGAIDPALPTVAYATDQADSLESELQSFLRLVCLPTRAARGTRLGDPTASLLALIQTAQTRPLPVAGGTGGGPAELYDALLAGLGSRSSWPALAACAGRRRVRRRIGGRGRWPAAYEAGGSTNGADAEEAIDCLDHPVDRNPSSYPALADRLAQSAPVFGPLLAWGLLGCATWPVLAVPHTGAGSGRRGTADPGGGHHRRPGHPVLVGGGPGPGS